MAYVELQPGLTTGLTLSANFYSGGALALTQALTEAPGGSGVYCYPSTMSLAIGRYVWTITDAGGIVYAVSDAPFQWNGTANVLLSAADIPIAREATQQALLRQFPVGLAAYLAAQSLPSPILHWRMDALSGLTETDVSGNSRDGTYNNAAYVMLGQPGATADGDTAVLFTDNSGQLAASTSNFPAITSGELLTVIAFVKVPSVPGSAVPIFDTSPQSVRFYFNTDGAVYAGNSFYAFRAGLALPLNQWVMVAGVYTAGGSQTYAITANGTTTTSGLDGSGALISASSGASYLAALGIGNTLDELFIIPAALTLVQLQAIHALAVQAFFGSAVNIGQWQFVPVPASLPNSGPVALTPAAYDTVVNTLMGTVSQYPGKSAVVNRNNTLPFFLGARYERVVWAMIGDSNQIKDGYGWQGGFGYALNNSGGLWGTGLILANGVGGGVNLGYLATASGSDGGSGAPIGLGQFMPSVAGMPAYAYCVTGQPTEAFDIIAGHPVLAGDLSLHLTYGVNSSWTGSFTMGGRYDDAGPEFAYAGLPQFLPPAAPISTGGALQLLDGTWNYAAGMFDGGETIGFDIGGDVLGITTTTESISAGATSVTVASATGITIGVSISLGPDASGAFEVVIVSNVVSLTLTIGATQFAHANTSPLTAFTPFRANSTGLGKGPIFLTNWQADDRSKRSGYSSQTLVAYGGYPTSAVLVSIQSWGQTALKEWLRQAMLHAGPSQLCCFRICEGYNDYNDTSASWNKVSQTFSAAAGNTQQGFYNNTEGVMLAIIAAWTALGYPATSLYFVLTVSQPNPTYDATFALFRAATDALSAAYPNTCSVHLEKITNFADLSYNQYYEGSGTSPSSTASAHMVTPGYNYLASAEVAALQPLAIEVMQSDRNGPPFVVNIE